MFEAFEFITKVRDSASKTFGRVATSMGRCIEFQERLEEGLRQTYQPSTTRKIENLNKSIQEGFKKSNALHKQEAFTQSQHKALLQDIGNSQRSMSRFEIREAIRNMGNLDKEYRKKQRHLSMLESLYEKTEEQGKLDEKLHKRFAKAIAEKRKELKSTTGQVKDLSKQFEEMGTDSVGALTKASKAMDKLMEGAGLVGLMNLNNINPAESVGSVASQWRDIGREIGLRPQERRDLNRQIQDAAKNAFANSDPLKVTLATQSLIDAGARKDFLSTNQQLPGIIAAFDELNEGGMKDFSDAAYFMVKNMGSNATLIEKMSQAANLAYTEGSGNLSSTSFLYSEDFLSQLRAIQKENSLSGAQASKLWQDMVIAAGALEKNSINSEKFITTLMEATQDQYSSANNFFAARHIDISGIREQILGGNFEEGFRNAAEQVHKAVSSTNERTRQLFADEFGWDSTELTKFYSEGEKVAETQRTLTNKFLKNSAIEGGILNQTIRENLTWTERLGRNLRGLLQNEIPGVGVSISDSWDWVQDNGIGLFFGYQAVKRVSGFFNTSKNAIIGARTASEGLLAAEKAAQAASYTRVSALTKFTNAAKTAYSTATSGVSGLLSKIKLYDYSRLTSTLRSVKGFKMPFQGGGAVSSLFSKVGSGVSRFVSPASQFLANVSKSLPQLTSGFTRVSSFIGKISPVLSKFAVVGTVIEGVVGGFKEVLMVTNKGGDFTERLLSFFKGMGKGVFGGMANLFADVFDWVGGKILGRSTSFFNDLVHDGSKFLGRFFDDIGGSAGIFLYDTTEWVKDKISFSFNGLKDNLLGGFTRFYSKATKLARDTWVSTKKWVREVFVSVKEGFTALFGDIREKLLNLFPFKKMKESLVGSMSNQKPFSAASLSKAFLANMTRNSWLPQKIVSTILPPDPVTNKEVLRTASGIDIHPGELARASALATPQPTVNVNLNGDSQEKQLQKVVDELKKLNTQTQLEKKVNIGKDLAAYGALNFSW